MLTTAKLLEQQLAQAGMLTFAILWLLIIYFPYALEHSLQYSCLNNPMDRGAWWAAIHGVAKNWTRARDWVHMHWLKQSFVFNFLPHHFSWLKQNSKPLTHFIYYKKLNIKVNKLASGCLNSKRRHRVGYYACGQSFGLM